MIDYSSYKKYFTPGGEFTLSGSDYIGYIEVFNGVPCEFNTRKTLEPSQTFTTDILTSKYFFDRVINDKISLPYTRDDIIISPNDHLNYNLIKDRLNKLHENNAYTFSRLFIPNNNIPATDNVTFAAIKNDDDTAFTLLTAFEGNIAFENTSFFSDLGGIKNFVGKKNTDLFNNFAFFCITDTKFIALTSNELETSIIEISNKYETVENELEFSDLRGITVNDKFLFITDAGNNVVIKYEIAGYFNNDYALSNRRNFIEVLGGEGSVVDLSRFKAPAEIACNNRYIAVHDSGNYIIKVFDVNFNYIRQLRGIPLRTESLAALEFNPNNNMLYVLTYYETNRLKLYVYGSDFVLLEENVLDVALEKNNKVRNISFSQNDSNFWYICTDGYVYKRLVNRPTVSLGRFQSSNIFSNNIDALQGKNFNNYITCRATQYRELLTDVTDVERSYFGTSTEIQTITSIRTSNQTELSSLSSVIIDIPVEDIRNRTVPLSTEFITTSSVFTSPILDSISSCSVSQYYTIDDTTPVNNFWNNTKPKFVDAKFHWNARQLETTTTRGFVLRPLKYYRFVMYTDSALSAVCGAEPLDEKSKNTGLKHIKLNVAMQPQYSSFTGFDDTAIITSSEPIYIEDTYDKNILFKNIAKTSNLGEYRVSTYASVSGNYGEGYKNGDTVFKNTYTLTDGWTPSVSSTQATRNNAYLEIALPVSVALSSIEILSVRDTNIVTPRCVEILGSYGGITFTPIASADLGTPTAEGIPISVDIYEDVTYNQVIVGDPQTSTTSLTAATLETTVTGFSALSSDDITPLFYTISTFTTKLSAYSDFTVTSNYKTSIISRNYSTSTDTISVVPNNVISDTYKACRVLPCTENYDDIILFSNGRIYFIKESNEYKCVLKSRNYKNFGLNAFSLNGDEYIQASTINKEFYKVLHDIFTLKNNIIGRFSGEFDSDGVIILDDYNYNIDYLDITGQSFKNGYLTRAEFEKYFINENEKSITGVINRALTNIFNLQVKLFEITQADTQTNIIPIYNSKSCVTLM